MKIRTDFVTNSSSSSFISFVIKNKKLASIFRQYKDLDFGIFDLEIKNNEISGNYYSDGSIYTSEIDELGLVPYLIELLYNWSEELSNISVDRYGSNYFEELAEELSDNELEINDELVSADITEAKSVTDGNGSSYRHVTIKDDGIKTLLLDENTWDGEGDESLIELIQENMYSDELDDYAQEHGKWTTGYYPTKHNKTSGRSKYPQNARKIISLVNQLDEGQLNYLLKELTSSRRETLPKKENIGESVYFVLHFILKQVFMSELVFWITIHLLMELHAKLLMKKQGVSVFQMDMISN